MGTFALRSASAMFLLVLLGMSPAVYAQGQSCLTVTSLEGMTPAVNYDGSQLKVQIQGKFQQEGQASDYTVSASNGAVVFSRQIAAGTDYSVTPLANAVKVCVQQATAAASANAATSAASSAAAKDSGSTGGTDKKSCLDDKVNCDIGATLESLTAPESPAFTVLGVTPQNVTRPTSPADFAVAVTDSFDQRGNFQSGLALDVAPFMVLGNKLPWWSHYGDVGKGKNKYWWVRPLARTTLSFGTTKGASDSDPALRLAAGLSIVLYDERDPRLLYGRCIRLVVVQDVNATPEEQKKRLQEARDRCKQDSIKKAQEIWNATSLMLAGAPTWFSKDGTTANMQLNGGGYWASGALRLGTVAQVIGHFRRLTGEEVPNPTTPKDPTTGQANFVIQSSTLAGGSLRFGSAKFNGKFEGLYVHKKLAGILDIYPEFSFGLERKLAENLYLDAAYRYAPGTKLTASGFLTNLKWNFNKTSQLDPRK